MSILTNFSIGAKLRLAFGALFVALTLVGGAGLYQSSRLNDLADDIVTIHVPALTILGRMAAAVERFRQLQAAALVASTAEEIAIVGKRHSEAVDQIQTVLHDYQALVEGRLCRCVS